MAKPLVTYKKQESRVYMFQKAKVLIELDWSTRKMEVFGKKKIQSAWKFLSDAKKDSKFIFEKNSNPL